MKREQSLAVILEEIDNKGEAFCYTKGFSMLPMLKEGRDISVLQALPDTLCPGDVVLFVRPDRNDELVLHRIVKAVSPEKFLIRGDNTFWDEPVMLENIKAVLKGFFRKGKYRDCKTSKAYRAYTFAQLHLYFLRKFFCRTLRIFGARIKNNVFHLNNFHLDDILRRK
ncbi:MAG: S24/S26 family peptidase [Clostridia bacterium]|nr:S24/S26 family peptidase [Clostridia bacterium]